MRSRRSGGCAVMVVMVLAATPFVQGQSAGQPITREEVGPALEELKQDENLNGQRKMRMLRWKESGRQSSQPDLGWLRWVAGFFGWMGQSARYLVWLTIALLAGWLGIYLFRAIKNSGANPDVADAFVPPTHVRNLDIRPESLPPNVGAAAKKLWERGDHRAALSLLYRGLLSRLTHVHRVPILDSSTEGDCLSLLPGRVAPKTGDYATRLVDAWRGFVYGGAEAETPAVHALCDGFSAALDRAAARTVGEGQS